MGLGKHQGLSNHFLSNKLDCMAMCQIAVIYITLRSSGNYTLMVQCMSVFWVLNFLSYPDLTFNLLLWIWIYQAQDCQLPQRTKYTAKRQAVNTVKTSSLHLFSSAPICYFRDYPLQVWSVFFRFDKFVILHLCQLVINWNGMRSDHKLMLNGLILNLVVP